MSTVRFQPSRRPAVTQETARFQVRGRSVRGIGWILLGGALLQLAATPLRAECDAWADEPQPTAEGFRSRPHTGALGGSPGA